MRPYNGLEDSIRNKNSSNKDSSTMVRVVQFCTGNSLSKVVYDVLLMRVILLNQKYPDGAFCVWQGKGYNLDYIQVGLGRGLKSRIS